MNIRNIFILALVGYASLIGAQPSGMIVAGPNDVSFATESNIVVSPSEIRINMQLRTSTEQMENMLVTHVDAQTEIFQALDGFGVSFEGQSENEFEVRENSGFMRRSKNVTATSRVSATAVTDSQLTVISELIDKTATLSLVDYTTSYKPEDSVEEIQKAAIASLIAQSQAYESENNTTLRPKGLSQMNISSEAFGEEIIKNLLENYRLPGGTQLSSETFELIGVQHWVNVELVFQ